MSDISKIKKSIANIIKKKVDNIDEIISATIVGSFNIKKDISSISDIDIIVIVNKLDKISFDKIIKSFKNIKGSECHLPDYTIKINSTFGPLKFNSENNIVFHLMIYDVEGHRKHVIESPFTCYDWQLYKATKGIDLKDLYPSNSLQLNDLIKSRRGLLSYIDDLEKKVITYREYQFKNGEVFEIKKSKEIDKKHKNEYAYHVLKFLMINILKILCQQNKIYDDKEIALKFKKIDTRFKGLANFYTELSNWKNNQNNKVVNITKFTELYIKQIDEWYTSLISELPKLTIVRHGKTKLNDGTFLGIHRNPDITDKIKINTEEYDCCYTGTLKRTISTGKLLNAKKYKKNDLINEINYGDAEGLTLEELQKKYPKLISDWSNKKDSKFPKGENLKNVENRLTKFLNLIFKEIKVNSKTAIVSHNVVIRILLKMFFKTDLSLSYLFNPAHLETIQFRLYKKIIIPELSNEQRIKFREQNIQWKKK